MKIEFKDYNLPFIASVDRHDHHGMNARVITTEAFRADPNKYLKLRVHNPDTGLDETHECRLFAVTSKNLHKSIFEVLKYAADEAASLADVDLQARQEMNEFLIKWVDSHVYHDKQYLDIDFDVEVIYDSPTVRSSEG